MRRPKPLTSDASCTDAPHSTCVGNQTSAWTRGESGYPFVSPESTHAVNNPGLLPQSLQDIYSCMWCGAENLNLVGWKPDQETQLERHARHPRHRCGSKACSYRVMQKPLEYKQTNKTKRLISQPAGNKMSRKKNIEAWNSLSSVLPHDRRQEFPCAAAYPTPLPPVSSPKLQANNLHFTPNLLARRSLYPHYFPPAEDIKETLMRKKKFGLNR